jgi:hypothetical protein
MTSDAFMLGVLCKRAFGARIFSSNFIYSRNLVHSGNLFAAIAAADPGLRCAVTPVPETAQPDLMWIQFLLKHAISHELTQYLASAKYA